MKLPAKRTKAVAKRYKLAGSTKTRVAFDPYDDSSVMIGSRFRGASGTRATPAAKARRTTSLLPG